MIDHALPMTEACPCCGAASWRNVPYLPDMSYIACKACHYHVQVRRGGGDRREAFLAEQEKFYSENTTVVAPSLAAVTGEITERRLATIRAHLKPGASLIEAGPGGGDVITALAEAGYRTAAAEHSKTLADRLQSTGGIDVYNGDFVDHPSAPGSYDAYCSFHVIEHVVDFQSHLALARERVAPGGLAFIATPNASGWEQRLPFRLSPNNDTSHFQLFSTRALERYLTAHGWEMLEVQTPSYAIAWLRILTKIVRRARGQDESATGGQYAADASANTRRVVGIFKILTAPFRKLQELARGGNEVFVVARRKA